MSKKRITMKRTICAATAGLMSISMIMSAFAQDDKIMPVAADYGYYVDEYLKNDDSSVKNTLQNPAIGVLAEMLDYFTPGTAWDNGTILNKEIHEMNMSETSKINQNSTDAEKELAFYDDLRDGNYSMISGLGVYSDEFIKGANAKTSITSVPADASTVKYADDYKDNGMWADSDSTYGGIVDLVTALRNGAASTSSAKKYYKYMRPFRWSRLNPSYPKVTIIDSLKPQEKTDPSNDGGYPSGHTNGANIAAIAMAYAVPEQYSEMMLRSSELGNSRIVAGMHSCLDVIGGRMMSTAIAAANLNAASNSAVKSKAVEDGKKLVANVGSKSDYDGYQQDKQTYLYRMTYNIKASNADTSKEMVVPKGAEVLLETRLPYLTADQRRYVLYTTGISSGYSVLDDAEGWGRLNLFEASNGYGAFITDTSVIMDASKGGFNAADNWRNDIGGTGSLTKDGTGMLVLSGDNSYTGGTTVKSGSLRADYKTAFGNGKVTNSALITENTDDTLVINGSYVQDNDGVLELTVSDSKDYIQINGEAALGGKLIINLTDGYIPAEGFNVISSDSIISQFDEIVVNAPDGCGAKAVYTENSIKITGTGISDDDDDDTDNDNDSRIDTRSGSSTFEIVTNTSSDGSAYIAVADAPASIASADTGAYAFDEASKNAIQSVLPGYTVLGYVNISYSAGSGCNIQMLTPVTCLVRNKGLMNGNPADVKHFYLVSCSGGIVQLLPNASDNACIITTALPVSGNYAIVIEQ